jgi:hypothetical protein
MRRSTREADNGPRNAPLTFGACSRRPIRADDPGGARRGGAHRGRLRGGTDVSTRPVLCDVLSRVVPWGPGMWSSTWRRPRSSTPRPLGCWPRLASYWTDQDRRLTVRSPPRLAARVLQVFGLTDLIEAEHLGPRAGASNRPSVHGDGLDCDRRPMSSPPLSDSEMDECRPIGDLSDRGPGWPVTGSGGSGLSCRSGATGRPPRPACARPARPSSAPPAAGSCSCRVTSPRDRCAPPTR